MATSSDEDFKPGSIVKLKKLVRNKELNNKFGIIKKQHSENSYRVMMAESSETERAVKVKNLEKIVQCPNELKSNFTGVVVWPEIVSQEYPIVQWLELPVFERNLKIWVKEVYKNPYRIMEPAVKSLDQKRAMAEKLYEHLGWVMMSNRCQTLINREHLKLYYEHDHSGKING